MKYLYICHIIYNINTNVEFLLKYKKNICVHVILISLSDTRIYLNIRFYNFAFPEPSSIVKNILWRYIKAGSCLPNIVSASFDSANERCI